MAGVLRTPRQMAPVPALNMQMQGMKQGIAANDEVARILKGLKLDRKWFETRLVPRHLEELRPMDPREAEAMREGIILDEKARKKEAKRASIRCATLRRQLTKSFTKDIGGKPALTDFDIYLNEAVMPVLAQAMDALCRQLTRMREQGDNLDPKVRARFNPLTWMGQQLLRRHPKCSRTPRRQLLHKSFKDWSDYERGRRDMLRKREEVNEVFNHFVLRGSVPYDQIWTVVGAVDDELKLSGILRDNVEFERAMKGLDGGASVRKEVFQPGFAWTFDHFWYYFGNAIMKFDIVPYSLLVAAKERQAAEIREQEEWREKVRVGEQERDEGELEKRRLLQEYEVLYEKIMAQQHIRSMLEDGKILTGDDVRNGDIGFQYEVPPHGDHISLLADLLVLLGFERAKPKVMEQKSPVATPASPVHKSLLRSAAKATHVEHSSEDERYWDDDLASAWAILQKVHHVELCDGVVDGEVLKQVLVPPVGFNMLKGKVEYELERKAERGDDDDDDLAVQRFLESEKKPTMEQLAMRLGMTMARLEWLHKLFETYLEPEVPGGPAPVCLYPDCPASLGKAQMRLLVADVEPDLTSAQFEARFRRIDKDGSGLVEFDEFAQWVHSSDVRIMGTGTMKMTFEEIANRYQESVEIIEYLHSCFQDQLPDGLVDGYPDKPVGLHRHEALFLASLMTPNIDKGEFNENFDIVDKGSAHPGFCDFDEFVEMLELDDLPAELRDRFDNGN